MKRIYQELVSQRLAHLREMVFLVGPCQVGKTLIGVDSAAKWPMYIYLNCSNMTDKRLFIEGPDAVAIRAGLNDKKRESPVLVFNKIQKIENWQSFLQEFFTLYGRQAKVIVTSNTEEGARYQRPNIRYQIHPLTVAEIVSPTLIDTEIRTPAPIAKADWDALLEHGGFPEPFKQRSEAFTKRFQAIRWDKLFQEKQEIENLAKYLITNYFVDYEVCAKKLGLSKKEVERGIGLLNELFYSFSIPSWSNNGASRSYLYDWSASSENQKLENLMAAHLLKAVHFWNDRGFGDYGLHYMNVHEPKSPFLVTKKGKPWFLVLMKSKTEALAPTLIQLQKETGALHAFQVTFDLPFEERNCFDQTTPTLVSAQAFLSQLV